MLIKCRDEPAALMEREGGKEGGRQAGRKGEEGGREKREIRLYFSSFLLIQYPHY